MQDAVGVVNALEIVIDFRAEGAARERMLGVAVQPFRGALLDLNDPPACVGTVVPTGAANDLDGIAGGGHRDDHIAEVRGRPYSNWSSRPEALLIDTTGLQPGVCASPQIDQLTMRGEVLSSPRDNVIYKARLFAGRLGFDRCFTLRPTGLLTESRQGASDPA